MAGLGKQDMPLSNTQVSRRDMGYETICTTILDDFPEDSKHESPCFYGGFAGRLYADAGMDHNDVSIGA